MSKKDHLEEISELLMRYNREIDGELQPLDNYEEIFNSDSSIPGLVGESHGNEKQLWEQIGHIFVDQLKQIHKLEQANQLLDAEINYHKKEKNIGNICESRQQQIDFIMKNNLQND